MSGSGASRADSVNSNSLIEARRNTLTRFEVAWAAKDLDSLVQCVTDDCVFSASVGPEPGATYSGREAVREGFRLMLMYDSSGTPGEGRILMGDNFAVVEWSYRFTRADGTQQTLRGCDIFEFHGALIRRKDAFRKTSQT